MDSNVVIMSFTYLEVSKGCCKRFAKWRLALRLQLSHLCNFVEVIEGILSVGVHVLDEEREVADEGHHQVVEMVFQSDVDKRLKATLEKWETKLSFFGQL